MGIKNLDDLIKSKRKQLETLMQRKMPVMVGRIAKDHFQENFRQGGFVNEGFHPWPKAKRLLSGRTDAASNNGTLLSGNKTLFKSVAYVPSDYRVRIFNDVIYAPIHNWGGFVDVSVTDRMRRFAWAKFYKASEKRKKTGTGQKKRSKRCSSQKPLNVVICFQKCIFVVLETTDCVYTNHNQLIIPISRIKKTSCFQT